MYTFDREEYEKRVAWFQDARFGMFIHWGLYAIPARGEWIRSQEQMSLEAYNRYFEEFDPKAYDPKQWARLAKKAGMKYAVMTAKHHDGFCLFDSQYTDYKSTNTRCGRDLIREYLDAFRAEGIRVGVYYSLLDWRHPDYPHYQDRTHPMRNDPAFSNENRDFDRYLQYMHAQVRELCTNYGKLDIIWFDFSYDNLFGVAWKATELVTMVRELQPGILIDNRLEGSGSEQGSLMTGNMKPYHGDFACPEQIVPSGACRSDRARRCLGSVPDDEQSLGLLQYRPVLQACGYAGQKARRMRLQGRQYAPERRPGREWQDPGKMR